MTVIGIDASRALIGERTGVHWYVAHLIAHLQLLPSPCRYIWYSNRTWVGEPLPGSHTAVRVLRWPITRGWTQVRLSAEMLFSPPDVLIIPASATPYIHPKKTIAVIHDIGYLQYPDYLASSRRSYLAKATDYAVRSSWKIATVSQWTKKELLRCFSISDPDRIVVAPIGIDTERYRPVDNTLIDIDSKIIARFGITKPYIITVGRIDMRKNLLTLARAWQQFARSFPQYSLVHAGPMGYDGQRIIDTVAMMSSCAAVRFLGWISEDDKIALIRQASAFAFPSLYEGFGMPLLEAQACGIPCIASNTSSLPEVGGRAALYVDPHSSEEFSDALIRIITDEGLRNQLCRDGLENVKRYTWQRCARIIIDAALS